MKQANSSKQRYERPFAEAFRLSMPLNVLETLSTEGDISDWVQEQPVDLTEVE